MTFTITWLKFCWSHYPKKICLSKVLAKRVKLSIYMLSKKDFCVIHMTVTLDLQKPFKITAYPFIKGKNAQNWSKGRENMLRASFPLTPYIWPENWFNVTLLKSSVFVRYEPKKVKWRVYMLCKRDFFVVRYDLHPWLTNFI